MKILDACCGSKMFWFDKENPDVIGDFRNMQFSNDEFDLVVFDPPHLVKAGDKSWLVKKIWKVKYRYMERRFKTRF